VTEVCCHGCVCHVLLLFWDAFSVLFLERGSDGSGFTCRSRVSRVDETLRWDGQTVVLV
jgi:hypothetical protein